MSNTWMRWWLTGFAALAIATAALADGEGGEKSTHGHLYHRR